MGLFRTAVVVGVAAVVVGALVHVNDPSVLGLVLGPQLSSDLSSLLSRVIGIAGICGGVSPQSEHQKMLSDLWDQHCAFEFDPSQKVG